MEGQAWPVFGAQPTQSSQLLSSESHTPSPSAAAGASGLPSVSSPSQQPYRKPHPFHVQKGGNLGSER